MFLDIPLSGINGAFGLGTPFIRTVYAPGRICKRREVAEIGDQRSEVGDWSAGRLGAEGEDDKDENDME